MTDMAHKQFPQPDEPAVLAWRYLDLPKLLSLLLTKELHLTRLDALEDKFEGTLPLHTEQAMLAELRPTMTSEKAWAMIEKAAYFGRKLRNPELIKEFVQRYFGATSDGAQDNFAATFGIFSLFCMVQLTRIGGAAGLATLETKGEKPELQAQLDDSAFSGELTKSVGILPGNQILVDLETNYERIPPERREATIRDIANWMLSQFASNRQQLFVNCWHLGLHESEAMWRIYCGREDGVAIVLRYSHLRDSIKESNSFIGAVKYISYETGMLTELGTYSIAMYKRKEFEHENEARIVQQRIVPASLGQASTSIQMSWDPEAHIERIVISPYSRPWYAGIVKGIVAKIAPTLSAKVVESSMSRPPFIPGVAEAADSGIT